MLTYVEPCAWCSSSISSTYYPLNVNKSPEHCPNLSSNDSSTSLISRSDSIFLTADYSSDGQSRRASITLFHSSFAHPNDYHTNKRIEELHERMDEIQICSFLKFINHHLSLKKDPENLQINDFIKDLSNGHVLIDLIEILASTKLKRERGGTRFHSLTNVQYVLDYLKQRMQHINISPYDIVAGNRKQMLALLWIIMKTFDFPDFRLKKKNCFVENTLLGFGQDRSILLKWLNHILNHCLNSEQNHLADFHLQTWNDGYYLSVILKYLIPLSIKYLTMQCFAFLKELNTSKERRFQTCLSLSKYCFDTNTTIDQTDRSDKCLFKYFTELQQNVLISLKSEHMGKLIHNNPYTKQILDTVNQTTEHSSRVINDNEQYLVCIEEEKPSMALDEELSSIPTVEKSRLLNDEQEDIKLKRIYQWEKTEDIQSHSHRLIDDEDASREKETEGITEKPQLCNDTIEEIEQKTDDQAKRTDAEDLGRFVSTVTDGRTKQITGTNSRNQYDETLKLPTIEVQQVEQIVTSHEEIEEQKQRLSLDEEAEQFDVKIEPLEKTTSAITENGVLTNTRAGSEPSISRQEEARQTVTTIEENKKSTTELEESESSAGRKSLMSANERLQQSNIGTKETVQSVGDKNSSATDEELFHVELERQVDSSKEEKKSEQQQLLLSNERIEHTASTVMENEPSIDTNRAEEQNEFTIEHEKLAEPLESQPIIITDERLQHLTSKESVLSVIINEEIKQNAIEVVDTNASIRCNEVSEQPSVEHEGTRQLLGENELSNQSGNLLEKVEQPVVNKPRKSPSNVTVNKKTQQSSITVVQNDPLLTSEKLEQSNKKDLSQGITSNGKATGKRFEKPVAIESQHPIASNGQSNKSIAVNKKSAVHTNILVPMTSLIQENSYSPASNEQRIQSTMVVKELEQTKSPIERPTQTAASGLATRCSKYSEIVSKQTPKVKTESVQETASFTKQEPSTITKKKVNSSTMSTEKSEQSLRTAEEIRNVPIVSTKKESEKAKISFEKENQATSIIEEPSVATIAKEEPRKSPAKSKKSRRSNGKKGKAKHSPQQSVVHAEGEIKPLLPLQNPIITVPQDQTSTKIQSQILSTNNENPLPNSSALRSRKSKKKKKTTAATSTTLIETSSPPRHLFVVVKDSLRAQKIVACKCLFILVCLCFSILILVLSHK